MSVSGADQKIKIGWSEPNGTIQMLSETISLTTSNGTINAQCGTFSLDITGGQDDVITADSTGVQLEYSGERIRVTDDGIINIGSFSGVPSGTIQMTGGTITLNTSNGKINLNGNVKINGTQYGSSVSDRNLKHDISTMDAKMDAFFDNLEPKTFGFIFDSSEETHCGFIAQNVEESLLMSGLSSEDFAGLVIEDITERDTIEDENGNVIDAPNSMRNYLLDKGINKEYSLRYSEFISLNTWQIQKLKTKVNSQEQHISELEAEVDKLKQTINDILAELNTQKGE